MKKIDLHMHTNRSDGLLSPEELVSFAISRGLSAIAVCDHDTFDGVAEAVAAGEHAGLEVVPGIELSVEFRNYRDVHLLGYFMKTDDPQLLRTLEHLRDMRSRRGILITERVNRKLQREGKEPVPVEEVVAAAQGSLGRPHIARALVSRGYAADMEDAFASYLEPCDVPKEYMPMAEALAEVKRLGGVPVLAHPQSITRDRRRCGEILAELREAGLEGVELWNQMAFPADVAYVEKKAAELGLAVTGGSDYHGSGDYLFAHDIPYFLLEALRERQP